MKQIINNRYLKIYKFFSSEEVFTFLKAQQTQKSLSIEGALGNNYYCYVCYHSLTREKQFILSFSSDENEENLNFMYWNNLFILDTGNNIFLIDDSLNLKTSLEITTPLIGLYVINNEKLLVLEETFMRVINYKGEIIKSELFDLIEDFSIKDNLLSVQTNEENRVIELI